MYPLFLFPYCGKDKSFPYGWHKKFKLLASATIKVDLKSPKKMKSSNPVNKIPIKISPIVSLIEPFINSDESRITVSSN